MKLKRRTSRFWSCDLVGRLRKAVMMAARKKPGQLSPLSRLVSAVLVGMMVINCNLVTFMVEEATNTPTPDQVPEATTVTPAPDQAEAAPTTPAPDQSEVEPVSSPELPDPPAPLAVSLQDPEESARTLGEALAGPDNLAAWLGLYQALGIPVIGEDGIALDGSDDPIGPAYWQVWYSAGLDLPGRGIPLSDAGRLLGFVFELNPEDTQTIGESLLADLQTALDSEEAAVRLLGAVARERILRSGSKLDILDSATTAQTASIDVPMVQLIFWVALRGALAQFPTESVDRPGGASLVAYDVNPATQGTDRWDCTKYLGGKDATYWVNWVILKGLGGFQLPGMDKAFPGMVAEALEQFDHAKDVKAAVGFAVSWANVLARLISLKMQLASMELVAVQDPDKLERTKTTTDGKTATTTWQLRSDPGRLPGGNELRQCLISLFTSTLGVRLNFPKDGPIPGAELNFTAGKNIPDRVLFPEYDYRRRWTDQNGECQQLMLGAAQRTNLPDTATAVEEEYSVFVSAQPEEAGLNSMLNIFFGGLLVGAAPNLARILTSLIDLLKTFQYDMGEYVFPMVDWVDRYEAYDAGGRASEFTLQNICSLEKPFVLSGSYPGYSSGFEASFTPTSATHGDVIFTNKWTASGCVEFFRGRYVVVFYDQGEGAIEMQGELSWTCAGGAFPITTSEAASIAIRQAPDMVCPDD